jgi:hypothetical protein
MIAQSAQSTANGARATRPIAACGFAGVCKAASGWDGHCEKSNESPIDFRHPVPRIPPHHERTLPQGSVAALDCPPNGEAAMLPKGPETNSMGRYLVLAQVGAEMVAPIAIGVAVDYYCGSTPWGVVVGTIVGFVGGLAHLVSLARKLEKEDSNEKGSKPKTDAK